ncbi:histidine phosphatase superfamily [Biscogniauxia marginata]|nr:histidine phosphatase superfamily [Biscogniauxia marginata]
MAPTIHIMRHAEGWHNIGMTDTRDPTLTPHGRLQCAVFNTSFPLMNEVTHLVASPMRRTIDTCILSFTPASDRLKIILLSELQEAGNRRSSEGSSIGRIQLRYGARVDTSLIDQYWLIKNKYTKWDTTVPKVEARAREARVFLRKLAAEAGDDNAHIVVVTHSVFAHWLTEDFAGTEAAGYDWANMEYRSYQFVDLNGQDAEATLTETASSCQGRGGVHWSSLSQSEREEHKKNASKFLEAVE